MGASCSLLLCTVCQVNHVCTMSRHTVTVTGNLLNTKVLTLVSRQLSQPVQSPSNMQYRPPGSSQGP